MSPASRMELVPFSGIRKVFERAKALEREGRPVIFLETGRPDFDTPAHIKEAAKRALDAGDVHYTSNYGTPELRAAIAEKLKRENGLTYDPDAEIIVTVGAAEAVFDAFLAFQNPGDEVLYPEPSWLNCAAAARLAGAIPVPIPSRESNGYQIDPDEVRRRITSQTRLLIIASPHNPTGAVQSPDRLRDLADLVVQCNLLVISDEIYERIIYDDRVHVSLARLPGMGERTITINGFSKAFSMTGWRLGYAAAPQPFIQAMNRVHQYKRGLRLRLCAGGRGGGPPGPAGLRGHHGRGVQTAAGFDRSRHQRHPRAFVHQPRWRLLRLAEHQADRTHVGRLLDEAAGECVCLVGPGDSFRRVRPGVCAPLLRQLVRAVGRGDETPDAVLRVKPIQCNARTGDNAQSGVRGPP